MIDHKIAIRMLLDAAKARTKHLEPEDAADFYGKLSTRFARMAKEVTAELPIDDSPYPTAHDLKIADAVDRYQNPPGESSHSTKPAHPPTTETY